MFSLKSWPGAFDHCKTAAEINDILLENPSNNDDFFCVPAAVRGVSRIARSLAAGRGAKTQFCCARATISNKGRWSGSSARPMQQVVKTRLFQSRILARFAPSTFPSAFYLKVGFSLQEGPLWRYETSVKTPGSDKSSRIYLEVASGGC